VKHDNQDGRDGGRDAGGDLPAVLHHLELEFLIPRQAGMGGRLAFSIWAGVGIVDWEIAMLHNLLDKVIVSVAQVLEVDDRERLDVGRVPLCLLVVLPVSRILFRYPRPLRDSTYPRW
jgi:hypothetical protein